MDKSIATLKLELANEQDIAHVILNLIFYYNHCYCHHVELIFFGHFKKEKISNPSIFETLNVDSTFHASKETELWVEKFKPKDYFELLSDDVGVR